MRPITLEIEGLQSFNENRIIDFKTLGETGLFGIFGPTGSGKSTILDAITFALFGDVRRAKNGTQGIINTSCRIMKVAFTFELLKEGTRKKYRVERVSQKKKNTDNVSVIKLARLMEVTDVGDIPLCDKATDVTNKVTELIGLNQKDFTRAVVLPQNSFQEFMLMNNSDRRRMLERVFYLEEYGKLLTEKLNRKTDGLKSCLDTLTGELKGYQDASDDALKEARKAMETAATEKERALKAFKKLEHEFNQARDVWALVQEMTLVEEQEQLHAKSAQDIEEKKMKLTRAEKAEVVIDPIRKNRELTGRLKKISEQLEAVENKLPRVKADLMKYQKSHESLKKERALEQPRLVAKKARLEDARILDKEIASAAKSLESLRVFLARLKEEMAQKAGLLQKETEEYDRLTVKSTDLKEEWDALITDPEYRQRIQEGARLEDDGSNLKKTINDLRSDKKKLNECLSKAEARLDQIKNAITDTQKAIADLTEEKDHYDRMLNNKRTDILKKAQELQDIKGICRILKFHGDQIKGLKAQMERTGAMLDDTGKKNQALLITRDQAAAACEKLKRELEQTDGMLDRDAACRLAKQLKSGTPCPVCGSEHHPKPAVSADREKYSELESSAGEIRRNLEAADKAFREAENALLINGEQLKTSSSQYAQIKEELTVRSGEYETERLKLPETLGTLDPENIISVLEGMERDISINQKEVENREKTLAAMNQRLQKLAETQTDQRARESGVLSEIRLNRENIARTERMIEETEGVWEANRKKVTDFLACHAIPSIHSELERLTKNDQRQSILRKELDGLQKRIRLKEVQVTQLKEELQVSKAESIKGEAELEHLINEKKTKEIRIRQLAADANIEDEIKVIEAKLTDYETRERSLEEKLKNLETDYQNLKRDHSLFLNQKKVLSEDLENDENRLNKILKDMNFTGLNDVENALLSEEERKGLGMAIDEYERARIRIQADKERLSKKLNSRTITQEGWKEINKAWQEVSADRENRVSESDIASHHYQNLKAKHERWLELTRKLEEANKRMSLLEQIRKLLGGNKGKDNSFIDYIAEERLRYVAARASETLGVMTRFRYALELDVDNGFVIRDNANGGTYRMVTTLSGGETFLTSLSLALALSEQIQLKGQSPLEFFFLDEGFGTLDRSLLDSVIDSLERISKKERMIGLISHVPELRSRIGRRLIVEPPAPAGEGTRVRIERA